MILLAREHWHGLNAYLQKLAQMRLPEDYEVVVGGCSGLCPEVTLSPQLPEVKMVRGGDELCEVDLFDACVAQACGAYLLLIREPVEFDVRLLDESIRELGQGGDRMSFSATGKFVLAEKAYYLASGGLRALLECANLSGSVADPSAPGTMCRLRNLQNEYVSLCCGHNTVIDPDVVIDSPQSVKIGSNCVIRKGVVLRPEGGEIVIGDNCVVNHYCVFHGKGGIYIGNWTILEPHCALYAHSQTYGSFDLPIAEQANVGKGIYLMGDNWIGGGVVICDDVTIGKGTMVGPNSTVEKSLPMASLAHGSPARSTGKRHVGPWDSRKEERAVFEGMPKRVSQHVIKRAALIKGLVKPDDCVLDVGCGEGLITGILAEKTARIVGCDYSAQAIQVAKKHCPAIEFICCNSTDLPFHDASFSAVTLSDVAEHLMPIQFVKTLEDIRRILRPGGTLILATPITGKGVHAANYAHIYEYSEAELREILGEFFCEVQLIDREFGLFVACNRYTPVEGDVARENRPVAGHVKSRV